MTPSALLVHVPDVQAGLDWYRKAFPQAKPVYIEAFDFTVLDIARFCCYLVR